MKRLFKITEKKQRLVIGLMSGTSHDGVDSALVSIRGNGLETEVDFLCHLHCPYPTKLKRKIQESFNGCTEDICRLNFELGELFAHTAIDCIRKSGVPKRDIDLIGSHGQTIYHIPPQGNEAGSTLQIGEADVIAERTGIVTISDFRKRDMAAGGHGAPLVPYADFLLFRKPGKVKAVQNIGGIANVTVVTEKADDIIAFDTGPGNALLDEAVRIFSGGNRDFDTDGAWAENGSVDYGLLDQLMSHPYLQLAPPKSTGREIFGSSLVEKIIKDNPNIIPEDLLATVTSFTVQSIHKAYEDFIFPGYSIDCIIVSGGGCQNRYLMSLLRDSYEGVPVILTDELGIPWNAKESVSFAILANETIMGMPGNLPPATGARIPVILGKISL